MIRYENYKNVRIHHIPGFLVAMTTILQIRNIHMSRYLQKLFRPLLLLSEIYYENRKFSSKGTQTASLNLLF